MPPTTELKPLPDRLKLSRNLTAGTELVERDCQGNNRVILRKSQVQSCQPQSRRNLIGSNANFIRRKTGAVADRGVAHQDVAIADFEPRGFSQVPRRIELTQGGIADLLDDIGAEPERLELFVCPASRGTYRQTYRGHLPDREWVCEGSRVEVEERG